MKKAVAYLEPFMDLERETAASPTARTKILLATVKGDVHDIGKNIVGVVLACNNYDIVDLGVMVTADTILDRALEEQVDVIGLSGLITPSLDEMAHVASEMQRRGISLPLLIGGATTSPKHTAIKIAPRYESPAVHVLDASKAVNVVRQLTDSATRETFDQKNREAQQAAREAFAARSDKDPLTPYAKARERRLSVDWAATPPCVPEFFGTRTLDDIPLDEIVPYIDWSPFFHAWELRGVYPRILDDPKYGEAARELLSNAQKMLDAIVRERSLTAKAVYGFFPANTDGDDIVLWNDETRGGERARFHMLRQQHVPSTKQPLRSLADFVAPKETSVSDSIGAFAVTTGIGLEALVEGHERAHDDYNAILAKALADRLAEALAEWLHARVRSEWGYGQDEDLTIDELIKERYRGIRPAAGYPACPDHTEKATLFDLLDVKAATGISLTENFAMFPTASVSGLYFSHPESRYFAVGRIGRDQVESYAARKGMGVREIERWLAPNLDYDPDA